jgi:hypothetical protein
MMVFHIYFNGFFQKKLLETEEGTTWYSFYETWSILNKVIYSIGIIIIGKLYRSQSSKITDLKNFQFTTNYEDSLISRLFSFNFFNFYLPMFLVALLSNFFEFMDIYYLVLSQLVLK